MKHTIQFNAAKSSTFGVTVWDRYGAPRTVKHEELPPNARVLTREQVERAIDKHHSYYSEITCLNVLDELFGEEVGE